ncbi:MAG: PAS domain S-box protein, partial [Anaerolineales bacterium]|nr:PAS domain S-box protein [Anaerolineales bacterium]
AAVEQAIEGIAVADMDGVIQVVNSAWAQMHGYMLDEVLGKNLSIFHTPCQLQEEVLPFNEQVVKTGFNQGEVGHIRKDGTVFPTQMGTALLRNEAGYPVGFVGIAMDITEPKLAEEFLRLQSGALEAAANSIIITDRDGTIQWANRAFTQLTGYTLEEAIGKNPRLLVKSGKYEPSFYKQLWETILSGQVWHGEIINRHKDNTLYTEEMSITPLFDHNGDISHFIAIKQDITQRKLTEHALREEKERYRSLYENVPVGLYRTTPDGRILMANPAFVQILGYKTFEDLAKRNLEENGYGPGYSRADFKQRI